MAAPTITSSLVTTGTGTSASGSLTIAAGDFAYVLVILSDGSPGGMTGVTSSGGGGAFSSIGDSGVVQSFLRCHIFRSTSPTPGTVTITATPAASTGEIGLIAWSMAGVDSGTPNGTPVLTSGNDTADAASGTVSSGTDALVLDALGRFQNTAATAGAGQTVLGQANQGSILQVGSSSKAGAASVTTSWNINAAGSVSNWQWVLAALSINGATGGGGGSPSISSVTPSTFRPGDTVTVTGTNFGATQGSSTFDIDGAAITPATWADTAVTFMATRGALAYGSHTLTLTNGTAATASVTLAPPVGWAYYTIGTPASSGLLPFSPALASGDEMALQTVGGLVAGATDGTASISGTGYVAFAYEGWSSGSGWGTLNVYTVFAQSTNSTGKGTKGGALGFTGWARMAKRRGMSPWRLLLRRAESAGASAAGWQVFSDWVFQNPSAPTTASAAGVSAATAQGTAVGASTAAVPGAAAATAQAVAATQATVAAPAAAAALAQASAGGNAIVSAAGSAAATSQSAALGIATSAASATAAAVGQASAQGAATVAQAGAAAAPAQATSAGASTASASGAAAAGQQATAGGASTAAAAGASAATAQAAASTQNVATGVGTAAATGQAAATYAAIAARPGAAQALAQSAATGASTAAASGASTASGQATASTSPTTIVSAAGTSAAVGSAAAGATAITSAAGVSAAAGQAAALASAIAAGTGVAAAVQQSTAFMLAVQTIARAATAQATSQAWAGGVDGSLINQSDFYRYDVPGSSLRYDVPGEPGALRYDVPGASAALSVEA